MWAFRTNVSCPIRSVLGFSWSNNVPFYSPSSLPGMSVTTILESVRFMFEKDKIAILMLDSQPYAMIPLPDP